MDRHVMLLHALPTWLARQEVDEVVVVDWSSSLPVEAATACLRDPRVRVARVPGQRRWMASRSHNLGARLASGELLLRLDADYLLLPGFFERHHPADQVFYSGNWRQARDDNERHLTGAIFVSRRSFFQVNGYNERIVTYGYEDDDLFERLQALGLTRRDMDLSELRHIPHGDAMRVKNQDVADVQAETALNKRLAHARPWGLHDEPTAWIVRPSSTRGWVCEAAPSSTSSDPQRDGA